MQYLVDMVCEYQPKRPFNTSHGPCPVVERGEKHSHVCVIWHLTYVNTHTYMFFLFFILTTTGLTYWEADVLGTVRYPEGVKLITASFSALFGSRTGAALQVGDYLHSGVRVII